VSTSFVYSGTRLEHNTQPPKNNSQGSLVPSVAQHLSAGSHHQSKSWRKFDFCPTFQCSMIFLVIPNFEYCPDVRYALSCSHMRLGRKIGLNKKYTQPVLNNWSILLPTRVRSQAKRLDYTQPISYWSRYLCCFSACIVTYSVPVVASRQCRILSTNVHWQNSLEGFRRFTLQVKITSLGSTSAAYTRSQPEKKQSQ